MRKLSFSARHIFLLFALVGVISGGVFYKTFEAFIARALDPVIGWTVDGIAISTATLTQAFPELIPDGSGGTIVTWQDNKGGSNDIYAQRINSLGGEEWTANGIIISAATGSQGQPQIISDGSGGAIITWHDSRNGDVDVYAQRINDSGVVQWTTDGVEISAAAGIQNEAQAISDGSGGAIVTWTDARSGNNDIYAQRINASGVPQWTTDGVAITTASGDQAGPQIASDGSGGAIITWHDPRNGDVDVYAQRINDSGVVQWTTNGVVITSATGDQVIPQIVTDGSGVAVITWTDLRNGVDYDIYAQKINDSGVVQWTTDGVVISAATSYQFESHITSDGSGGAIITWNDLRSGNSDIYAQRINANGVVQWTADGLVISAAASVQDGVRIVSNGSGGAIITWDDGRNGFTDIYAQEIHGTGVVAWTADGVSVSAATGNQHDPQIASDGSGEVFIAWTDLRNGNTDVYAQKVSVPPPPEISILQPNGSESLEADTTYEIQWNARGDNVIVDTIDLEFSANNSSYFAIPGATGLPNGTRYSLEFTFGSLTFSNEDGKFNATTGVAVDSMGNVYVVDEQTYRVQKFDASGNFLTKWGSFGTGNGQFNTLYGIAVDGSGNVYVADSLNYRIQKFDSSGNYLTQWGSNGTGNGQFNVPNGVAVDGSGNVYVADTGNHRIQKFDSSGNYLTQWGSNGTGNSQFSSPRGIGADASGNVYVADTQNHRIQKFDSSGSYLTQWGTSGLGNGQFAQPNGVAVDDLGDVYVADTLNDRIQKFTSTGTYITQWDVEGSSFSRARGVAADGSGNVYVADRPNHRVQKFQPGGSFTWTVPQGNTSQAKILAIATDVNTHSAQDESDAPFTIFGSNTVSGTCRQSDNSTNCADGATVKVAVDGVLVGGSDTINSGSWNVPVGTLSSGDVITVFLDGVAEANEAVAVTKYDGTGEITGVELIESHLTIGSNDNETITNTDLALYDNSVSGDEDIFFEVDANNDFTVDFEGGHDATLLIFVGNTYRPDSSGSGNVTAHYLQNDGTLIADENTIFVSGDWLNMGTFTANTSTVDFNGEGTQSVISDGDSFATIVHSGSGTLQLSGALTVTSAFNNDDGTFYLNGYDWTMTGATFSNDGTLQIQGSETITGLIQDLGAGTALLTGDGPAGTSTFILEDAYFNLTIDADASETFEQSDDTVITNTLTVTSGTYSQNGFATNVNGANTLIVDGGTYEQGGSPLTVEGDLQVLNGGIFNGSNTGAAIDVNGSVDFQVTADTVRLTTGTTTVAGDWTNSMATGFDNNDGTIRLDTSAAAAVNGSTTWYNLVLEPAGKTVTFEAGEVQTFETGGDLSATGASGNLINLVSSDPGVAQWEITHTDENVGNLSYVSVTDGGCTASENLLLLDSSDLGNNDECWVFLNPDLPDAIDTLTAVGIDEAAILSWEAPAENDSAIEDYIVEYGETSGFPGNAQVFSDGVSDVTGTIVTGLTNGVEYTFRVATVNGVGTGDYSNEDTAIPGASPIYPDVSTYLGGNGAEHAAGIGLDTSGNIVLSGVTSSTDFPISNELQTTVNDYDIYVTVLSPNGTSLISSTYYGGDGYDEAFALHTDSSGNIYVAAMTDSTDLFSGARTPNISGYDVTAPVGNFDTVILKFNEDVSDVLFGTYLGGSEEEAYMRRTMKADDDGMVYVVGHTYSNDFPLTANAFDTSRDDLDPEFYEGFVAKIDTTVSGANSLVYSSYLGGENSDDPLGVNFDTDGNIYVVGETYSSDFPGVTSGAFKETIDDANGDGFLVKIDPTGTSMTSLVYGTMLGGANDYDAARAVVVNSVTDVVSVCGVTYSSDLSTTTGAYDETYNANADLFFYQISPAFDSLLYGTFAGGAGDEECGDIHVDSTTGTLVFSAISSGDFPTTGDAFQADAAGDYDLLMGRFNPVGGGSDDLLFATYFGGTEEELDWGSYLDEANEMLYFAGETLSGNFPVNASAYETEYSGGEYDAVVVTMFMPNIPDAVNDLDAVAGNTQVTLTWSAPDDNGSAITDYSVEYGETSGFPDNAQVFNDGVSSSTGATVTGLTNGIEYSFRVATMNPVGTGASSNVDTATPLADLPEAITDLDAIAGENQVTLTWTAPADGGSPIMDYIVEYGETSGFPGNAQVFNDGVSSSTGATVTSLTNDIQYSFRVAAVNAVGTGAYSNVDTATPTVEPAVPDAITDLNAVAENAQVSLTWSAPADNGSAITDYIIEYGETSGFPGNAQVFADVVNASTGATVTGLVNATNYSFRVAAVNGEGQGPYSNVDTATPSAGAGDETGTEISVDITDFLSFSIENLAVGDEPSGDQPFGAGSQITDLTPTGSNAYAVSGDFGSPVYTRLQASTNSNDGYNVSAYAVNLDGRTNTLLRTGGTPGNSADEILDSLNRLPASAESLNTSSDTGLAFRLIDANTDPSLRESDEDLQWGDGDVGTALWAAFPLGAGAAQIIYDTFNFSGVPTIAYINWFVGTGPQQQSGSYTGQVTFTATVN